MVENGEEEEMETGQEMKKKDALKVMMERSRQMVSLSKAARGSKAAPRPQQDPRGGRGRGRGSPQPPRPLHGPRGGRGRGRVPAPPGSAKEAKASFVDKMF